MKKIALVLALAAFVGGTAFAHDGGDKGKGKKKAKCQKENCCKKAGATTAAPAPAAEPTKCTKGESGKCCSKGATATPAAK